MEHDSLPSLVDGRLYPMWNAAYSILRVQPYMLRYVIASLAIEPIPVGPTRKALDAGMIRAIDAEITRVDPTGTLRIKPKAIKRTRRKASQPA